MTKYISLSVGRYHKLEVPFHAAWTSDNPLVEVKGQGWIYARKDTSYPNTIANITAAEVNGSGTKNFIVTIVNWSANRINMELYKKFNINYNITKSDDNLYSSIRDTGLELFVSADGLETLTKVCDLPESQGLSPMLITPAGYFIRSTNKVYRSIDLVNWTLSIELGPEVYTLRHAFDYYYDSETGITYIYTGEYDMDTTNKHKVYRGTITSNGTETWDTVIEFYSRDELYANPSLYPACLHVHSTVVDKTNGYLWVLVGDSDSESKILYSKDHGTTWNLLGAGNQEWRALSIWFTAKYIYWAMDAEDKQRVFRIPRTWLETKSIFDIDMQKEMIADIENGSLWYHLWGKDDLGNDVVYLCGAAEGHRRDYNARVFMFREKPDESVEVEEVALITPANPSEYSRFVQLEPFAQDNDGYIYMSGRNTEPATTWKFRLNRQRNQSI